MRTLAAALLLSTAASCPAWACSGTALTSKDAGHGFAAIAQGQHYDDFDHLLRDKTNGQVVVCTGERCYPALLAEGGTLTEVMRLQGCRIAEASGDHRGIEWHDLDTPGFDRNPEHGDNDHADDGSSDLRKPLSAR